MKLLEKLKYDQILNQPSSKDGFPFNNLSKLL